MIWESPEHWFGALEGVSPLAKLCAMYLCTQVLSETEDGDPLTDYRGRVSIYRLAEWTCVYKDDAIEALFELEECGLWFILGDRDIEFKIPAHFRTDDEYYQSRSCPSDEEYDVTPRQELTPRPSIPRLRQIYVIGSDEYTKIGISKNAKRRRKDLQGSNPHKELILHFSHEDENDLIERAEEMCHRQLDHTRVRKQGFSGTEWFMVDAAKAIETVKYVLNTLKGQPA